MRGSFAKWGRNVAARSTSMNWCSYGMESGELRPRVPSQNPLKLGDKVVPHDLEGRLCQVPISKRRFTETPYRPINSRTYFTGGLPYEITWSLYFLRLKSLPSLSWSAARRSRCSVASCRPRQTRQ